MSVLYIDFETRSTLDIGDCGAYVYSKHPSTDIWCMAWAFDEDEPEIWHPGLPLEFDIVEHVEAGEELHAWNANFERLIWREILHPKYKFPLPKLEQYFCSMAQAAAYGLPQALDYASEVLNTEHQKDMEGNRLMKQMSRPRSFDERGKPVWWDQDPVKFKRLCEYCKQDVRTERAVVRDLKPLPPNERKIYLLDQQINDRGVQLDIPLAQAALKCAGVAMTEANERMERITGGRVGAVTQVLELTSWVKEQGVECDSVAKDAVAALLLQDSLPENVRQALSLRSEAGKSSVAKIEKMLAFAGADARMRGMLAYHGAATGRWAGRGPQPQNYPRGSVADVEMFLSLIEKVDVAGIELFEPALEVLSSILRSLLRARKGRRLIAADFAAIEARVLAWLAGQKDAVEDFRLGVDKYKKLASQIYRVSISEVTKKQRFVGKTGVLGLGYQMGWKKFILACKTMAKVDIGEDEAKEVVSIYRETNGKIVDFWDNLQEHAMRAVKRQLPPPRIRSKNAYSEAKDYGVLPVNYYRDDDWLYCMLPSGRTLKYFKPRIVPKEMPWLTSSGEPAVRDVIQVMGFNGMTRKWERQYLYGGLLAENVVQAVARDIMAEAMIRVEDAGYDVILTVHDEVVAEADEGFGSVEEFEKLMCELPAWAEGCPIAAEAWEGERYRK